MTKLTLGEFRELTNHLADSTVICYNNYDKGAGWISYKTCDLRVVEERLLVLNPGKDIDIKVCREVI